MLRCIFPLVVWVSLLCIFCVCVFFPFVFFLCVMVITSYRIQGFEFSFSLIQCSVRHAHLHARTQGNSPLAVVPARPHSAGKHTVVETEHKNERLRLCVGGCHEQSTTWGSACGKGIGKYC